MLSWYYTRFYIFEHIHFTYILTTNYSYEKETFTLKNNGCLHGFFVNERAWTNL